MYELPDFSRIESAIPWGYPHGDPLYLIVGAIVLFLFSFFTFAIAFRIWKWLSS